MQIILRAKKNIVTKKKNFQPSITEQGDKKWKTKLTYLNVTEWEKGINIKQCGFKDKEKLY